MTRKMEEIKKSPTFYDSKEKPHPPYEGILYGEITFWIALFGMAICILGLCMSISGYDLLNTKTMVNELWAGKDIKTIWEQGNINKPDNGYWFIKYLPKGDAVIELGITIISLAAIIGMTTLSVYNLKKKNWIYFLMATIVLLIMLSTMTGALRVR